MILIASLGLAGFAKGATALGLPLIATPILAGIIGPRAAVIVIAIPSLAANTILVLQGRQRLATIPHVRGLLVTSVLGAIVGAQLLARLDQRTFAILITAMVLVFLFGGDRFIGETPDPRRLSIIGPLVGFAGGVLQGTTSISGPLVASYFHALHFTPRDFVVAVATVFELSQIAQVGTYAVSGLYSPELFVLGLGACVPTLGAMMLGAVVRNRIDPIRFRRLIVVLLVASTANLIWRTFAAS